MPILSHCVRPVKGKIWIAPRRGTAIDVAAGIRSTPKQLRSLGCGGATPLSVHVPLLPDALEFTPAFCRSAVQEKRGHVPRSPKPRRTAPKPFRSLDCGITTPLSLRVLLGPGASRYRDQARGRFPLPTTEKWGEGEGEGNEPLTPTLSPLVPRREREQQTSAMVGVSRCARWAPAPRLLSDWSLYMLTSCGHITAFPAR